MSTSRKIFICNALGTFPPSTMDLKELFTSNDIFSTAPDVITSDFKFNPSGLVKPIFVIPGGSTSMIGLTIKQSIEAIKSVLGEQFDYVGICAGAFLGVDNAELFLVDHKMNTATNTLTAPSYFLSTSKIKVNFGFVPDFNAYGGFYPNDSYMNTSDPKSHMPYRVRLSLAGSQEKLNQLYLQGPGFFANSNSQSSESKILAMYDDKESYSFTINAAIDEQKTFKHFPAIIQKMPNEKHGARFLSGTHIETCVPNSQLLRFFKTEGKEYKPLSQQDHEAFEKEQKKSHQLINGMLKETLR